MSEYQYYEFQAIDRCLTEEEMKELRRFSSRADITPYSFSNDYSWGSFKGDEDLWMEEYFDGFLYYANWGTHILKLRIPAAFLDVNAVQAYCDGENFAAYQFEDKLILDFNSSIEEGYNWEEDLRLAPFLGLRTDLMRGDLRCLYLGWLACIQNEQYDEEELEPDVPPGLQDLNPALTALADFLRIDFDLITAAAEMSPSLDEMTPKARDLQEWMRTLSQDVKDGMLKEIFENSLKGDQNTAFRHVCQFSKAWQSKAKGKNVKKRTVGELLEAAERVERIRIEQEAQKATEQRAEKQRLERIARDNRLNEIVGKEERIWDQIEVLASEKKAKSYEQAVELIIDLRDLAERENAAHFSVKFDGLKQRHSSKSSFIQRLRNL